LKESLSGGEIGFSNGRAGKCGEGADLEGALVGQGGGVEGFEERGLLRGRAGVGLGDESQGGLASRIWKGDEEDRRGKVLAESDGVDP
jgi:hypothetical protein